MVVDVEPGTIASARTILFSGDQILKTGPDGSVEIPDTARRIDSAGLFAIPGLWDMHIQWYHRDTMQLFPSTV